jgi:uncharacterized protein (TIGR03067 family)
MNPRLALVLIAAGCTSALGADVTKNAAKKDLEALQGEWRLVSATRDGKTMPADAVKVMRCTIKGDKFTITRDGKAVEAGAVRLDAARKPKAIDLPLGAGQKTALGIYELSGGKYRMCYSPPGKDRPKDFAAKEGTGHTLSLWEREKK